MNNSYNSLCYEFREDMLKYYFYLYVLCKELLITQLHKK